MFVVCKKGYLKKKSFSPKEVSYRFFFEKLQILTGKETTYSRIVKDLPTKIS